MYYSNAEERKESEERGKGKDKNKNKWHVPSSVTHGHHPGGQTWGYEHTVQDAGVGN